MMPGQHRVTLHGWPEQRVPSANISSPFKKQPSSSQICIWQNELLQPPCSLQLVPYITTCSVPTSHTLLSTMVAARALFQQSRATAMILLSRSAGWRRISWPLWYLMIIQSVLPFCYFCGSLDNATKWVQPSMQSLALQLQSLFFFFVFFLFKI